MLENLQTAGLGNNIAGEGGAFGRRIVRVLGGSLLVCDNLREFSGDREGNTV